MPKRMTIVMNPTAGQKRAARYMAEILTLFAEHGYECTVCMTQGRGDAAEIAARRAAESDLIVCIGGDGTLNETLAGLTASGAGTPIGYVPAGSTNDFAASVGLSRHILQAARDIVEGHPCAMDVGRFNGRLFSYVASCGAFTRTSYSTPQTTKNLLGHLAYILEGIKDLGSVRREHLRVEAEGRVFEDDYVFAAVSNATSIGGVLTLDKARVSMSDGRLELLLIRYPDSLLQLGSIVNTLRSRRYEKSEHITFFPVERAVITASPETLWTLDGEFGGGSERIEIAVDPAAVTWMLNTKEEE